MTMYLEHFGLKQRPFALLPDPKFIYWSDAHKRAYAVLNYGLETGSPITVIAGEIGSGKTTLLREYLANTSEEYTVGLISNAQGGRGELLHWVLMALGQETADGADYVKLFRQFQDFLIDEYARGKRTLLIVDEAQNLNEETLEELRMFSNINADADELLQIVLFGQPQLCDALMSPNLVQFAQRISAEYFLPNMQAEEVADYIKHRLTVAGARDDIFTDAACRAIHLASQGTPRLVNQLCDFALVYAFSYGRSQVTSETVDEVITDRRLSGLTTGCAPDSPEMGDGKLAEMFPEKAVTPEPVEEEPDDLQPNTSSIG